MLIDSSVQQTLEPEVPKSPRGGGSALRLETSSAVLAIVLCGCCDQEWWSILLSGLTRLKMKLVQHFRIAGSLPDRGKGGVNGWEIF